jgi:hypothetical protein
MNVAIITKSEKPKLAHRSRIYGNDRRIDVIYGPLSSMDLITKVTSLVLWINVLSGKVTVTSVSFLL